jgi:hypothetical protein
VHAGHIDKSERGVWRITDAGQTYLAAHWYEWQPRDRSSAAGTPPSLPPAAQSSATEGQGASPSEPAEERTHERLKRLVSELAAGLRKHPQVEVTEGPYRYDVVWKDDPQADISPSHAFEVQDRGSLDSALAKLQHARDRWRCELFLVVVDERDGVRARALVDQRTQGAFHRIRHHLTVLSSEELAQLHADITRHASVLQRLLQD